MRRPVALRGCHKTSRNPRKLLIFLMNAESFSSRIVSRVAKCVAPGRLFRHGETLLSRPGREAKTMLGRLRDRSLAAQRL